MNPRGLEKRYLPIEALPGLISRVFSALETEGSNETEQSVLERMTESIPRVEQNGKAYYRFDLVNAFIDNFNRALESKDASYLNKARGRKFKPIDIQEFIESREYMAQRGHVWPKNMEALWELFHGKNEDGTPRNYIEAIFGGAIGRGKNYAADLGLAYQLYDLSSFHDPQLDYGLAPGSSIVFVQQSKSLTLARKVVFDQFAERIKLSPYFRKFFMFDEQVKSELRFPCNIYIYPVGGNETAALGMNVYGGILDELNFMLKTADSVQLQYTNDAEYDQAQRLYTTMSRRITSRFMNHGSVPGKLILISSANYPDDFISRKIEEAKTNHRIFVSTGAQWEFMPPERYSAEKFLVDVGTETRQARIIVDKSMGRGEVLEVPVDYLADFERDIDGALRDLAGRPTGAQSPFFPSRDLIAHAMEQYSLAYENSLFIQPEILLGDVTSEDDIPILWDEVVNLDYVSEADPNIVRACHVDVGLTEDALGLCVGHIGGTVTVAHGQRFDDTQRKFIDVQNIQAPAFVIDGVLRVRSRRGTQVDLNRVRDLLLFIHNHLPFKWFSADAFQSAQLISAMRGAGIRRSGVQSVDTTLLPYTELRNAYHDRRIIHPNHPVLYRELIGLIRKMESGNRLKIDHPPEGSKDIADALAAVCYCLAVREARHRQTSPMRERKSERVQRRLKGDTPLEKQSRRRGTGEGRVDRMIRVRKRR